MGEKDKVKKKKSKRYINIFIVIIISLILLRVFFTLGTQAFSAFWEETTGTVTKDYKYGYTVDGTYYENDVIEYRPDVFENLLLDSTNIYTVNKQVKVFYSRTFPKLSVLKKGPSLIPLFGWLIPIFTFSFISIMIIVQYSSSDKLNHALKKMGFKIANGYFGQYNIEDASNDFSNFILRSTSEGSADYISHPIAAIEKDGRFIDLTRTRDYDNIFNKQVIEFRIETPWSLYHDIRHSKMHGIAYSQLSSTDKYLKIEELSHIYFRKRSSKRAKKSAAEKRDYMLKSKPRIRPELLEFENFETGIRNFDKFFGIKIGSLFVRRALSGRGTRDIVVSLKRWKRIIYDIIVNDDYITVRINPKRIAGYPFFQLVTFSKILSQLIDDLVSFAGTLEDALLSYKLNYKEHFSVEHRYVTVYATGKCKKCNRDLPINGPLSKINCNSCKTENTLDTYGMWRRILYDPYRKFELKKYQISIDVLQENNMSKLKWEAKAPICRHCKTIIPEEILRKQPIEKYSEFKCPNCNTTNYSFPPPAWAKEISPFMDLIYNGQPEGDENNIHSSKAKSVPWTIAYWFVVEKKNKNFVL